MFQIFVNCLRFVGNVYLGRFTSLAARPFLLLSCVCLMISANAAHAQAISCQGRKITVFDFRNPVLISGTALSAGAIYRFSNVASGIDARVRIDALTNAGLSTIDQNAGLSDNFQPELAGNNARSADFTITFVIAGTTTPVAIDFAASGLDIDGDSASTREYTEFSIPLAAYVLDTPTNLDINASGPSSTSRIRFEARTNFTAPGIDETATQNIATIFYSSTSTIQYRIGTLGTGNTTRLTSLDFSCPALTLPSTTPQVSQDFGDAPASYGTPVHDIDATIRLGATNSAETAPYNNATANADSGDDGVTFSTLRQSNIGTATISVVGNSGRLQCWVDWNGDGDFSDAGEHVATDLTDNGQGDTNVTVGTIGLSFVVPTAATMTPTFVRFRWSTTSGITASSIASNGEVEDYAINILGAPLLTVSKSSTALATTGPDKFFIPNSDVIYSISTTNMGTESTAPDSVFLIDTLPPAIEFHNGDIDGTGPEANSVSFAQTSSSLTFSNATDVRFSNSAQAPTSFSACLYSPVPGYDPAVKHICLNPKGAMASGGMPISNFIVKYRARIR